MNMIEKVGRAIFASQDWPEFHPAYERSSEIFETAAKAAIEAMREPTDTMILSGLNCDAWAEGSDNAVDLLKGTYVAMIDSEIAGGGE
jgi:hypothetical protein